MCWQSSVDDVAIEVSFEAIANGTRVRVDGIVPDGKTGGAGLSFVRMTPEWLPRWIKRRPAPRPELSRLNVIVHDKKPIKHHGFKAYVVEDLEGRRWSFAQARPTMV